MSHRDDRRLPPEEKNPGYLGKSNYERDDEEPNQYKRRKLVKREAEIDLEGNKAETVKRQVNDMKLFIEDEEHEGEVLKLFDDPSGWSGFMRVDGTYYKVNYSKSHGDIEGRFITKKEIDEETVANRLENHFEEWKLGRSWNPL